MLSLFKKIAAIAFVLVMHVSISYSEIEVKISVNKNEYLEAEPIICALSFTNNSEAADSVGFDEFQFNHIKFQTAENKEIIYIGSIGDHIGSARYIKLPPHASTVDKFNLLDLYIDKIVTLSINSAPGYFSAGQYTIKYDYYSKLTSNECTFIVKQPSGPEAVVFQKLMHVYRIVDGEPGTIDSSYLKKDSYYAIAKNYPESVYWEEAVYHYNSVSNFLNLFYTDTNVNSEFIGKFPNSYFVKPILMNLWKTMYLYEGGEAAVNSHMEHIIEKYENSTIFEIASEQLMKKDYLK